MMLSRGELKRIEASAIRSPLRAFATDVAQAASIRWMVVLAVSALLFSAMATRAEDPDVARRRAVERRTFTDAEIVRGFFKVTFGAEFHVAGRVDRIRKYDGPVRIFIDNRAQPNRSQQVAAVVADIRKRIRNLDLQLIDTRGRANMVVTLVRDRDLARTIRSFYGAARARRIQNSLEPQCLSGFRKDDRFRITHADVILVTDAGEFVFYDCVYEELLQALGPINDDTSVPWSMFNDDVQMGFFGLYDQFLLNILYHPRIRPGMTRAEVEAVLPEVLPAVRAWIEETNKPR
jgi:hypothetical protein